MILSKETSLFQHDKIKDGIDNASKEASNYLTDIDSGGVYVHAVNNESDGVRITDRIDIVRGDSSVAEYGTSVRIGSEALGSSTIYIDPGSADAGITNVFRILASNGVDAFDIFLDEDHVSDGLTITEHFDSSKYNCGGISELTFTPKSLSSTKVVPELSKVINGGEFVVGFFGKVLGDGWWPEGYCFRPTFTFIKGIDSEESYSIVEDGAFATVSIEVQVSYVASSNSFNILISGKLLRNDTGNPYYEIREVYLSELYYKLPGVLIPVHKFNGDMYLNCESIGATYLGLEVDASASSSTDAIDGDDKDLFNAIRKLDWYSEVIE